MLKRFIILGALCILCSCKTSDDDAPVKHGIAMNESLILKQDSKVLKSWWSFFNDPVYERLVAGALNLNAHVSEPKIQNPQNYDELKAFYQDQKIDLILDVSHNYFEYRYIQNQAFLLDKYIQDRQAFLSDLDTHYELNEDDTKAFNFLRSELGALLKKKVEFEAQLSKISKEITTITKLLPEYVAEVLSEKEAIPEADIMPILASPASIIANATGVVAARALFIRSVSQNIDFSSTEIIFPQSSFNRFFGISDDVFIDSENFWGVSSGTGIQNLDFSSFQSLYDQQGFTAFRNNVEKAVNDVETLVIAFSHVREQHITLEIAVSKKEQNTPLLTGNSDSITERLSDLEDHDALYRAHLAALRAKYEKAKILLNLYGELGTY